MLDSDWPFLASWLALLGAFALLGASRALHRIVDARRERHRVPGAEESSG